MTSSSLGYALHSSEQQLLDLSTDVHSTQVTKQSVFVSRSILTQSVRWVYCHLICLNVSFVSVCYLSVNPLIYIRRLTETTILGERRLQLSLVDYHYLIGVRI